MDIRSTLAAQVYGLTRAAAQPIPTERGAGEAFAARCGQCHRVAGVSDGDRAPDLSDIGARSMLGAGVLNNQPGALLRWLQEHQRLKPGNAMPLHDDLDPDHLSAIADWLETLHP